MYLGRQWAASWFSSTGGAARKRTPAGALLPYRMAQPAAAGKLDRPATRNGADNEEQNNCTDDGADHAADVKAGHARVTEEAVNPAAQERADDSNNNVTKDPTRALAGHDVLRNRADNESENNPG